MGYSYETKNGIVLRARLQKPSFNFLWITFIIIITFRYNKNSYSTRRANCFSLSLSLPKVNTHKDHFVRYFAQMKQHSYTHTYMAHLFTFEIFGIIIIPKRYTRRTKGECMKHSSTSYWPSIVCGCHFTCTEKPDPNKCRKLHIILGYFGIEATKFQPNIIIIICRKIVFELEIEWVSVAQSMSLRSLSAHTFWLTCSLVTVPLLIGAPDTKQHCK